MNRCCRISSRCIGYLCYSTTRCFACVVLLAFCAFGLDEAVLHYAKSGWAEGFGEQKFSPLFRLFRAAAGR